MEVPPDIPMYAFIKRELKNQIESGELAEGVRVPSEFELARAYGVSRNPTRQALRDLEIEGYIVRTQGRGSFVAPKAQRQKLFTLGSWRTVALACPHVECHYTRSVIQGFIQRAAEQNFHTMVYFLRFSNDTEFEFLADVRNSGIEGMAIWLQHGSERTLQLLQKFGRAAFPFVLIDRYVRGLETDFVVTNNEDAAFQLTRALINRGHRDVGFITSELDITSTEARFAGYRRALTEEDIPFTKDLMGVFASEGETPHSVVTRIMAHRRRPTAFFCVNDGIAGKLLDELSVLGYSVPDEVELAAVDDTRFAEALGIPMIAAVQQGYEMGRESADILLSRVANPKAPYQQRFLKADFDTSIGESRADAPARSASPAPKKGGAAAITEPAQN
ncbi:MAG: GntR family transcriptional regulator [Candidatus Hydrogenedentes bacterium]|nr:GntR family transcriptional regulator [Candidatus Hydrogenedentota bacterium]